jgi:hypothetical protein
MPRNLRDMHELGRVYERIAVQSEEATIRGIKSAAYRLEGMIPEVIETLTFRKPVDTGELKRSHYTDETATGARVGVDAPHAPFMEWGTRPHKKGPPPFILIADWAYRKGIIDTELEPDDIKGEALTEEERDAVNTVVAIMMKIARHGLEPRHFLAITIEEFNRLGILEREIKAELAKVR